MYILLLFSIILAVMKSAVYNKFAKETTPDTKEIFVFNAISYGVAALLAFFLGQGYEVSGVTIVCAFFYAIIVCSLQGLSVYAMKSGPMSVTSLMILYGMIIPMLAGPVFWKESLGASQIIGALCLVFSMWLISKRSDSGQGANKKWAISAVILFFLSGFAGLMEKIHQSTGGRDEKTMFLFVAYLIMLIISLGIAFFAPKDVKKSFLKSGLYGGISGVIIPVYAFINLTLAGKLDSMIYYPVANGGAFILTVLVSVAVFREKCTKKQIFGFMIGLISIIILSLPI